MIVFVYSQAPIHNPEHFRALGLNTPAGVLLAGPPGCGKTLLAKVSELYYSGVTSLLTTYNMINQGRQTQQKPPGKRAGAEICDKPSSHYKLALPCGGVFL